MAEEAKRIAVELVARLGRETQFHLDERHRHFEITNMVILVISVLLLVLAVFNVYFIHVLYQDLNGIVDNMDSMHTNLKKVNRDMTSITARIQSFDRHMQHMDSINGHTRAMAESLPRVSTTMSEMTRQMDTIETDMGLLGQGMTNIDTRFAHMTNSVAVMRENARQMARPMGIMNPFMP